MESTQKKNGRDKNSIKRRDFVKSSALAAGGFMIVPRHVLGGSGFVPPSEQVVIAGIGTGGQGIQVLETFARMKDTRVTAVCDVERERNGYVSWTWGSGKEGRPGG